MERGFISKVVIWLFGRLIYNKLKVIINYVSLQAIKALLSSTGAFSEAPLLIGSWKAPTFPLMNSAFLMRWQMAGSGLCDS